MNTLNKRLAGLSVIIICIVGLLATLYFIYHPRMIIMTPPNKAGYSDLLIAVYPDEIKICPKETREIVISKGDALKRVVAQLLGYGDTLETMAFPSGIEKFSGKLHILFNGQELIYNVSNGIITNGEQSEQRTSEGNSQRGQSE